MRARRCATVRALRCARAVPPTVAQGKRAISNMATSEVVRVEASAALCAATLQSSDIATGRSQPCVVAPTGGPRDTGSVAKWCPTPSRVLCVWEWYRAGFLRGSNRGVKFPQVSHSSMGRVLIKVTHSGLPTLRLEGWCAGGLPAPRPDGPVVLLKTPRAARPSKVACGGAAHGSPRYQ